MGQFEHDFYAPDKAASVDEARDLTVPTVPLRLSNLLDRK